jgi:flavin reductase
MDSAPPSGPAVDVDRYRQAMGRFATGVTVVTSRHRGHDVALTVASLTSVSLDPVLLLVSLHNEARVLEGIEAGEGWAVSVLPAHHRGLAAWLGEPGRPLHNQLARISHRRGEVLDVAIVDDALAAFECRTSAVHVAGDHSIVVGEVVAVHAPPTDAPALVHYRGGLGELR